MSGGAWAGVPGRLLIQSSITWTALVSMTLRASGGMRTAGVLVFMRVGILERQISLGTIAAKPLESSPPLMRFWLTKGVVNRASKVGPVPPGWWHCEQLASI